MMDGGLRLGIDSSHVFGYQTFMEDYDITMQPQFKGLEKIDVNEAKKLSDHPWFNRTLCEVNESYVRLGVFEGEFHWHKHETEDEFFYVVDGELEIDIENAPTLRLCEKQGVMVPKNVSHRPRAPKGATVIMVESKTIEPRGS